MAYESRNDDISFQDNTDLGEVDEMENAKDLFRSLDDDNDGKLSHDQFVMFYQGLGFNPTDREIQDLLEEADVHSTGYVDWDMYTETLQRKFALLPEERDTIRKAFLCYDKNGDGTVSVYKIREILEEDKHITQHTIDCIVEKQNNDGNIHIDDLISMIMME